MTPCQLFRNFFLLMCIFLRVYQLGGDHYCERIKQILNFGSLFFSVKLKKMCQQIIVGAMSGWVMRKEKAFYLLQVVVFLEFFWNGDRYSSFVVIIVYSMIVYNSTYE